MSMLRKSAVTVAIAGAGLASMSGAAFATGSHHGHDSHGHHSSCKNVVDQVNRTEGGSPANVLGGAQTAVPVNVCDVLNDNHIGNGITVAIGGTATTIPGPGEVPGLPDLGGVGGELPGPPTFPGA